jgi:hypothetical protein
MARRSGITDEAEIRAFVDRLALEDPEMKKAFSAHVAETLLAEHFKRDRKLGRRLPDGADELIAAVQADEDEWARRRGLL